MSLLSILPGVDHLMFSLPGGGEMIVIILIVLLLFGAKKIPELARGLGKGIREFKDASKEIKREIDSEAKALDPNNDR